MSASGLALGALTWAAPVASADDELSPDLPYSLSAKLPDTVTSPAVSASAPYTPAVLSLIAQIEPSATPTKAEIENADRMLIGLTNSTCHNVGTNGAPLDTTPVVSPLCWSDGLGIGVNNGSNNSLTTASPTMVSIGSSFDTTLANLWGQVEGTEGRNLMVTGLLGPQVDTTIYPNWGRGLDTPGEDPLVNGTIGAAQIEGMQGQGLMSQVKHFATNHGQGDNTETTVQDQALHEIMLPTYEQSLVNAGAAAVMCSYQIFQDKGSGVPTDGVDAVSADSPYTGGKTSPTTWSLDGMRHACEQPLTMNYVLRGMWGSKALVGPDYGGVHSASSILQGLDMEPGSSYFGTTNPNGTDDQSDTCADADGNAVSCDADGAVRVAGIPGGSEDCGTYGCSVANAVIAGALPLSVFNQSLARMLYQEERFGLLGCDNNTAKCANPGGIDGDRTGTAALKDGSTSTIQLGTKNGDAAIVEKLAEEGAVLLKNNSSALPLTSRDLKKGVAVSGPGAEYLVANPNAEGTTGYADRNAISPLRQLKALSGNASAFTYSPANGPTGAVIPATALSTNKDSVTGALALSGPDGDSQDANLDHTDLTGSAGQLKAGSYTWTGYVNVPTEDTYTFRIQQDAAVKAANTTVSIDGDKLNLSEASSFYHGAYYGFTAVPVATTNEGYVEGGLTNLQTKSAKLTAGHHEIKITFDNDTDAAASLRIAYSRSQGDIDDAAAAAATASKAIVFVHDEGRASIGTPPFNLPSGDQIAELGSDQVKLIKAVSAANPNTIVVMNTSQASIINSWANTSSVKSVLEMWNAGSEGGTATARLLLGQANPSGHTTITWPRNASDTIYTYNQKSGLYDGDTAGVHSERAPSKTSTDMTQGIYSGYRYYDKLGIDVQYPFGHGLSYSTFQYRSLGVSRAASGGLTVKVAIKNASKVNGVAVPQVYLGAPSSKPSGIQFAVRALAGFDRVSIKAGQTKVVTINVPLRAMQYWDTTSQEWKLATGTRTVYVGSANAASQLPLRARVSVKSALNATCANTQLNATTINGDLIVPSGAWCDLVNVHVTGNIRATGAKGVRITGSQIDGNVTFTSTKAATDPLSSGSNVICDTTISKALAIRSSAKASPWLIGSCGKVTVGANVIVAGAASAASVTNSEIAGNLDLRGSTATEHDNTVAGSVLHS